MSKVKRRKVSTPSRPASQAARTGGGDKKKLPIVPILIIGALGVLIVAIVLSFGGGSSDAPLEYGSPQIDGTALPRFSGDAASDAGLGLVIPEVQGASYDGTATAITNDGKPKLLIFLAHWCPHCQVEVPVVVDWLAAGSLPQGVEIISVATGIDRLRDNYPPSAWFEREGWTVPVIMDDEAGSVAAAFGLNAYPYWVLVNADGTVAGRLTGEVDAPSLTALAESLTP